MDRTFNTNMADRSQALLETAPDSMVIVNADGIIVLVNAQTERLFGYSKDELHGKEVEILIPKRFVDKHRSHRGIYSDHPKTRSMGVGLELYGRHKNGSEFPVEISLSPLTTEEGTFVSAAIRDISEKKQLENQIREANTNLEKKVQLRTHELEQKNKELEQFAYVASHDLQEPLRTISSFVDIFKKKYEGSLDAEADKMLEFISGASDRMKILIKDLLDYSRLGRQKNLEVIDCNKLLQEVRADLQILIENTSATIVSGALPTIRCYPSELKMLFQNLLSNSIKFRHRNRPPKITVQARLEDSHWHFLFQDNGIGINEKFRDRIFVIFQRLHTRSEYEGSGIGLAHCKKIVELHGGKIWVESTVNEGSTFHFTIAELK